MTLNPRDATLLSLVLPGAAHVLLGKPVRGAVAFVSTMALFFIGWAVLRDRMWFYGITPPAGAIASFFKFVPLNLLPEGLNFGAAVVASLSRAAESFETERLMRMPLASEHWACMLTGASGILSTIWAADANWLSRGRHAPVTPARAVFLSWLVPGLGHAVAGQRSKGLVMGLAVAIVYLLGMVVSGGHGVDRQHFSLWWAGAALFGPGLLFSSFVTSPMLIEGPVPAGFDFGVALCTSAGLMSAMIMSDAFTVAERGAADAPAAAREAVA